MPQSHDERRIDQRTDIELEVDLATYDQYFLSKLENVSISGAFIRTQNLYPTGTELKLRFKLPKDPLPIEATGEVMWTYKQPAGTKKNATGMGIRFKAILEDDRTRIAEFIANRTAPRAKN